MREVETRVEMECEDLTTRYPKAKKRDRALEVSETQNAKVETYPKRGPKEGRESHM